MSHLTSLSQFQLASPSLQPPFCTLIEKNVATLEYITLRHQQQKETSEWLKFVGFRFPSLRRLYLQVPTISADSLAFLSAHAAQLTYLTLHATTPNSEPTFEHAIASLCGIKLPKLTNIVIFYLGPAAATHIPRLVANAPSLAEVTVMLTLDATSA